MSQFDNLNPPQPRIVDEATGLRNVPESSFLWELFCGRYCGEQTTRNGTLFEPMSTLLEDLLDCQTCEEFTSRENGFAELLSDILHHDTDHFPQHKESIQLLWTLSAVEIIVSFGSDFQTEFIVPHKFVVVAVHLMRNGTL